MHAKFMEMILSLHATWHFPFVKDNDPAGHYCERFLIWLLSESAFYFTRFCRVIDPL